MKEKIDFTTITAIGYVMMCGDTSIEIDYYEESYGICRVT